MDRLKHKRTNIIRRKNRVKVTLSGSTARPRLSVHISNLHITAQIIDDAQGRTLAYVSTVGRKLPGHMTERAQWVGAEIAKKAAKANVKQVIFDRANKKYHGRVKALAESARKSGMEF